MKTLSIKKLVLTAVVILWGMMSCTSIDSPSMESQIAMGIMGLMDFKGNTLKRVQAGLPFVPDDATQPAPTAAFRETYQVLSSEIQGRIVYTLTSKEGMGGPVIFYLHGGAYSTTFNSIHWDLFASLIQETHCVIVAPDYPLPPKAHWEDSWAMVREVYQSLPTLFPGKEVVLMGDSAGGGFALALAQSLAHIGGVEPSRLILLSPWLDISMENPGIGPMASTNPFLSAEALRISGARWAGDTDIHTWQLSPINGALTNLPPITIFSGTADVLNPDARKLRELLISQGVDHSYYEYPHMFHVWMLFDFPESRRAKSEIFSYLR